MGGLTSTVLNFCWGTNSGAPALWAYVSEIIPPHVSNESGFGFFYAFTSVGATVYSILLKQGMDYYNSKFDSPDFIVIYLTILVTLVLYLMIAFTLPTTGAQNNVDSPTEQPQVSWQQSWLAPWRLIVLKPAFRLLCVIIALISIPETMETTVLLQMAFKILGISGAGHTVEQQNVAALFQVYSSLVALGIFPIIVGLIASKYGSAKALVLLVPFGAALSACPVLLTVDKSDAMIFFTGACQWMVFALLPQGQAVISHLVPQNRIGEAFGCLASVKQVSGFIAPILQLALINGLFPQFPSSWHQTSHDPQIGILIFTSLLMFCAWPFTCWLEARLRNGVLDAWVSSTSDMADEPQGLSLQKIMPLRDVESLVIETKLANSSV